MNFQDNWELSPEDIASLKRSMQDANDGLTYTLIPGSEMKFRCNPCGREANIDEIPFPHKLNCPMKKCY
jgi:hypothetical protein